MLISPTPAMIQVVSWIYLIDPCVQIGTPPSTPDLHSMTLRSTILLPMRTQVKSCTSSALDSKNVNSQKTTRLSSTL